MDRTGMIRNGEIVIDLDALEARDGARTVSLSLRETSLLAHLASRADRAVPRAELLVSVWGYSVGTIRTRTVDVHVQQLRAKLRALPHGDALIRTVRGVGYRFATAA